MGKNEVRSLGFMRLCDTHSPHRLAAEMQLMGDAFVAILPQTGRHAAGSVRNGVRCRATCRVPLRHLQKKALDHHAAGEPEFEHPVAEIPIPIHLEADRYRPRRDRNNQAVTPLDPNRLVPGAELDWLNQGPSALAGE